MPRHEIPPNLNFIEPESQCDYDLLNEVAASQEVDNILLMLLLDETLSDALRRKVNEQLKAAHCVIVN
ncbi:hypothetical protein PA25_39240 [Pseudoalteromonas sp. A25]|uniref:hypothetical protein n=1 Tax=Pseudoalteromonas sp. A25 TaxID=116092 RepID=UPI00126073CE|nr:hypothetical protein [Pseudoalteromonas sp. A25]BBN83939.1 hypothetical protein PA25_39240 [Pseudoalteromonas sp. A25]